MGGREKGDERGKREGSIGIGMAMAITIATCPCHRHSQQATGFSLPLSNPLVAKKKKKKQKHSCTPLLRVSCRGNNGAVPSSSPSPSSPSTPSPSSSSLSFLVEDFVLAVGFGASVVAIAAKNKTWTAFPLSTLGLLLVCKSLRKFCGFQNFLSFLSLRLRDFHLSLESYLSNSTPRSQNLNILATDLAACSSQLRFLALQGVLIDPSSSLRLQEAIREVKSSMEVMLDPQLTSPSSNRDRDRDSNIDSYDKNPLHVANENGNISLNGFRSMPKVDKLTFEHASIDPIPDSIAVTMEHLSPNSDDPTEDKRRPGIKLHAVFSDTLQLHNDSEADVPLNKSLNRTTDSRRQYLVKREMETVPNLELTQEGSGAEEEEEEEKEQALDALLVETKFQLDPSSKKSRNPLKKQNIIKAKHESVFDSEHISVDAVREIPASQESDPLDMGTGKFPSQYEEFEKMVKEGRSLLQKGKMGVNGKMEVSVAEGMLQNAVALFASAASAKPYSLEVVGLWGNALLAQGELKLKRCKEMSRMLPPKELSYSVRRRKNNNADRLGGEGEATSEETFQSLCEECENLLLEAGRKYRTALSMDRNDVRSLYNWGLALCFRAQLVNVAGGEKASQAADRIYLAAIDKFEAMIGISQDYAPAALLNWGLALRDRSRLRQMDSRERMKILLQARELFEDALRFDDPSNVQARGALVSCKAELQELREFSRDESGANLKPLTWF